MIGDFEARLAAVLGGRLAAPFAGRVEVDPGAGGATPRIILGVRQAEVVERSLGEQPETLVPGAALPRRVVHARCTVQLQVLPEAGHGRDQEMEGLDAALYVLDAPELRSGAALVAPGDPGFLIRQIRLAPALTLLRPDEIDSPLVLRLDVDGLFWPRGVTGQAGEPIARIVVRGVVMPIEVIPTQPPLVAGGQDIELTIRIRTAPGASLPFGGLAVAVEGPQRRAPAGRLLGGAEGAGGARLVPLTRGEARVTYRPPAQAASDELVIALDDSRDGMGLELGRFPLEVRTS